MRSTILPGPFTSDRINEFIRDEFILLEAAFPADLADQYVQLVWSQIGCDSDVRDTWNRPVIRHPSWDVQPFNRAVNTRRLHASFDQLVGRGDGYRGGTRVYS